MHDLLNKYKIFLVLFYICRARNLPQTSKATFYHSFITQKILTSDHIDVCASF